MKHTDNFHISFSVMRVSIKTCYCPFLEQANEETLLCENKHIQKSVSKKEYKGNSNAICKDRQNLEYISQIETHVLGKRCSHLLQSIFSIKFFHLNYFFKLLIPFSGLYTCVFFLITTVFFVVLLLFILTD